VHELSRRFAKVDYVTSKCPQCMGFMCWTCGMAIAKQPLKAGKHYCSMVRPTFADYDVCSYCYDGEYVCGDTTETREIGPQGDSVFIVGSWSNWVECEEMNQVSVGTFEAAIRLGDTRMEEFRLLTSTKLNLLTIHPVVDKASSHIRVEGPDLDGTGKSWLIDGHATGVPEGTVYRVVFKWDAHGTKRISWDICEEIMPNLKVHGRIFHSYFITDSLTSGGLSELKPSDELGVWSTSFLLPNSGKANFFLVRDRNIEGQAIYPINVVGDATPFVAGPDNARDERVFQVMGEAGNKVTVQLSIADGSISVKCSMVGGYRRAWSSSHDSYVLVGTWDGHEGCIRMEADANNPGVHWGRFRIVNGTERFQILCSGNKSKVMYPEIDGAMHGESVVCGPDKKDSGSHWCVTGPKGIEVEVILSLNEKDKRAMVYARGATAVQN